MTLRFRLTAAVVVVVAIGLLIADVLTYTALRSFLVRRVDEQLRSSPALAIGVLADDAPGDPDLPGGPADGVLPSGTYVHLFAPDGASVAYRFLVYGGPTPAFPNLPSTMTSGFGDVQHPFTVGSSGSDGVRYRVVAQGLSGELGGYTVVVAIPLTEVAQTLRRLLIIAGLVTLCVLAAMALLSWWTVRRELRPLERIEETAGAIAGGDLARRVDQTDPRTEVGRLGVALNVMLGRIEGAMDERRASEEALRRFLADASHELRTPLTSIRGYAELFRRGADERPEDAALAMRRIEQEGERMSVLVEDLLFLARAGEGRPIQNEPVDLAQLTKDAVHDARTVDASRDIALDAPSSLILQGDGDRLRQVLANLLANALAHTPADTPISVVLRRVDDQAELSVSDRGPGLSPEAADHVFEPFFRADPARERVATAEGKSTGLGLAIVAAIAESHGGTVAVSSQPGEGATFTVQLPVGGVVDTGS
jgi:two-component system OmpR family sensor kinase